MDILRDIDQQTRDLIMKAAETLATDTFSPEDRSVFAPENITEDIKLLVPVQTPIRNRTP